MKALERLKDDLEETTLTMVTVQRKDLEELVKAYERLKEELDQQHD